MAVNMDKPHLWKADIAESVDFYNRWFVKFAPGSYRETRAKVTKDVKEALSWTNDLTNISASVLSSHPAVLPMLRMATAPPLARDRLIGLAYIQPNLVKNMEEHHRLPPRMKNNELHKELDKIGNVILKLVDKDLFPWLENQSKPSKTETYRAATIVADRLCGAVANPIIRNAQEKRQLAAIKKWLLNKGYRLLQKRVEFNRMEPGTFAFRMNVVVSRDGGGTTNIPVDAIIMPKGSKIGSYPLLVEAKSAGDFTNTNKRRKEEAQKVRQLKDTYGNEIRFILFLCGYFDSGYLGYEAAEGIDWVWEHRLDDLAKFEV